MSDDRDRNGRFLPGCSPGPGRPPGSRIAELRAALVDAVTPEDVTAIIRKLVELARGGDVAAGRELLDRLFGKPLSALAVQAQIADADTLDAKRARLAAIAQGLGADLDEGAIARAQVREAMQHPDYLDYLRQRIVDEDAAGGD